MVHKGIIERRAEQSKKRGESVKKNDTGTNPSNEILVTNGHEASPARIALKPRRKKGEPTKFKTLNSDKQKIETKKTEMVEKNVNEHLECEQEIEQTPILEKLDEIITKNEPAKEKDSEIDHEKDWKIIESLDFISGLNKLSIRFTKKHNRAFRIQVFMNDINEIRPVTYSGSSTGCTFWKLLKAIMK